MIVDFELFFSKFEVAKSSLMQFINFLEVPIQLSIDTYNVTHQWKEFQLPIELDSNTKVDVIQNLTDLKWTEYGDPTTSFDQVFANGQSVKSILIFNKNNQNSCFSTTESLRWTGRDYVDSRPVGHSQPVDVDYNLQRPKHQFPFDSLRRFLCAGVAHRPTGALRSCPFRAESDRQSNFQCQHMGHRFAPIH